MTEESTKKTENISEKTTKLPYVAGNRGEVKDNYFPDNLENDAESCKNKIYIRVNAIKIKFTNVSFEHSVFDNCYFKNCVFDSCSFVGCKFIGCNLHLSAFVRCDFRYALFERTMVDDDAILKESPSEDNLKLRFARNLRMNFQQIGDAKSANQAISLELSATNNYLFNSWSSGEPYYSKKYGGVNRYKQFSKWLQFKFLDALWGNGESIFKLVRSIFALLLMICFLKMYFDGFSSWINIPAAFIQSSALFFGASSFDKTSIPEWLSSMIIASRFILFALLTSILVKRLGRR